MKQMNRVDFIDIKGDLSVVRDFLKIIDMSASSLNRSEGAAISRICGMASDCLDTAIDTIEGYEPPANVIRKEME